MAAISINDISTLQQASANTLIIVAENGVWAKLSASQFVSPTDFEAFTQQLSELQQTKVLVINSSTGLPEVATIASLTSMDELIDSRFLEYRLSQLSLGFFRYKEIAADFSGFVDSGGIKPFAVADTQANLTAPTADGQYALTLDGAANVTVYVSSGGAWVASGDLLIENGYLFSATSNGNGYYWFSNTWNQIDAEVDLSQFYTKAQIDTWRTALLNPSTGHNHDGNTGGRKVDLANVNGIGAAQVTSSISQSQLTAYNYFRMIRSANATIALSGTPTAGKCYVCEIQNTGANTIVVTRPTGSTHFGKATTYSVDAGKRIEISFIYNGQYYNWLDSGQF